MTDNPNGDMHISGITQEEASALFELRRHWEDFYHVALVDGVWHAKRLGNVTQVLTADSANDLKVKLQNDFAALRYEKDGLATSIEPSEEIYSRLQEILRDAEGKGLRVSVTSVIGGHHLEVRLA